MKLDEHLHKNPSELEDTIKRNQEDEKQSYAKQQLGVKPEGLTWNKGTDTLAVAFPGKLKM